MAEPKPAAIKLAWLLRLGYTAEDIEQHLLDSAEKLNPQTLIAILTEFGKPVPDTGWTKTDWLKTLQKQYEHDQVYSIVKHLLESYFYTFKTPLDGKKVFLDLEDYDLAHSVIRFNNRSEEGGYIRSGLAYRIPEHVRRLRFFVYWNDTRRVDIDLHASAVSTEGKYVYIGWNADYNDNGLISSGDVTHSDAAEYIDIDLKKFTGRVSLNINLYSGYKSFGEIDECFCGMMALESIKRCTKLYNAQNCFFQHFLTGKAKTLQYGYVDTENRCLVFEGCRQDHNWYGQRVDPYSKFSLKEYLMLLFEARRVIITADSDEADLKLVMGKASCDSDVSLIDNHFFI